MIIIICTDDSKLEKIAKQSAQQNPAIFGSIYRAFTDKLPTLGKNEHLFIIAHGAYAGDEGNPIIGDEREGFYVNGIELWKNLKGIFPKNYLANVYIDACESADHKSGTFSFAEVFFSQINVDFHKTKVYGKKGASAGLIALPGDQTWIQA